MTNILSIDMDWIMEPSIQIYNWLIDDDTEEEQFDLEINAPGVYLPADLNKFYQLNKVLFTKNCKIDPSHLYIHLSHKTINFALNTWKINGPYSIWNVDHHHDCGYSTDTGDAYKNYFKTVTCSNWAAHLALYDKNFKQYSWIGNFNSNHNIDKEILKVLPSYKYYENINVLDNIQFDYVFICKSPGWVPKTADPLVNTLVTTFESFLKL